MNKITPSSYNDSLSWNGSTDPVKKTFLHSLPNEITGLIFSRLKRDLDIVHFAQTCRDYYPLLTFAPLWRHLLQKYFPDSYANLETPGEAPSFYKTLKIANRNIKAWNCSSAQLLGHKNNICCLAVSDNLLVSGSEADHIIKIWNIKDKQEMHTLCGHKDTLTNLLIHDKVIISGAQDHTIKTWDITSGKLLQTFEGYQGRRTNFAVYKNKLISGQTHYGALRIWDLNSGERLKALTGVQRQISCITICGDLLFSGSSDGTIAIWDLETEKELTLLSTGQSVMNLVGYNGKLILALLDGTIEIWDCKNSQKQTLREGDKNDTFDFEWSHKILVYDDKLFSLNTNKSSQLWIWDLKSKKELREIDPPSPIQNRNRGIAFCNGQLFLGDCKNIQVLDFRFSKK